MPFGEEADLDILAVGSCRSVIFAVPLMMYGVGHRERLAERGVEPLREIAGQLQVLALVLADRHGVGLVEQDVGRLQDRVGEQPTVARSAPCLDDLSLNCVIRLASPKPVMQPITQAELSVLGHLRLHEQRAPLRVQPQGEQLRRSSPGCAGAAAPDRGRR